MGESMQEAMKTLAGSIALASDKGPTDVMSRKAAAIAAIEDDEGLSGDDFNNAVEMIMGSSEAATVYLAIKKPAARTRFLQSQLVKARSSM